MWNKTLFWSPLVLALAACSTPKVEPEVASSAKQASYAQVYPATIDAVVKDFNARQGEARKNMAEFATYPGKLKDPKWGYVLEIVERADEDGRSSQYVEKSRRLQGVATFFEQEKDDINRRVAGAVAYGAKKGGCGPEAANGVGGALKDAVDKAMEKELDDASESHLLVERYRVALGKENAGQVEKQAQTISRTSFIVSIALVDDKVKTQQLLLDASGVKRTADDFIAAEKTFQAEKKTTEPEKKASQARVADMEKSKAAVDGAVKRAEELLPQIDQEVQKIQKEYQDALAGYTTKIKAAKDKQK